MPRRHRHDNALGTDGFFFFFFFFWAIFSYTQSDDDTKEDLSRFGYKPNMKVIKKKHPRSEILANYFNHAYKSGGFSLFFWNYGY